MGGYRFLDSEVVATGGFLTLSEERFESPGGVPFTRFVVRHPGAVVAVPLVDGPVGPEVLCVRQYRPVLRDLLLELPAGKLDVPGESPEAAMVRELAEEVRCRPGRLEKLAGFWNSPGFSDEYTHVYLALDLEPCDVPGDPPAHGGDDLDEEEQDMTVERILLADAGRLVADGTITDAKTIIGLLLAQGALSNATGTAR